MALEGAAKEFFIEPNWNRVFKNTFDVIKEYLQKALIAIATIDIAVRIGANLQAGDILCIVIDVYDPNLNATQREWLRNSNIATDPFNLEDMAGPVHATMASYGAQDPTCHRKTFNSQILGFEKYGPFLIMIQILSMIILERINILLPKMNQQMERFYKSVVEETLVGRDPDIADDLAGSDLSVDKILRTRQKEEICGSLKRSSTIYNTYFCKNILQIFLGLAFSCIDLYYVVMAKDEIGYCDIPLGPNGVPVVTLQCRQKRFDINQTLIVLFIIFMLLTVVTNLCSIVWLWEGAGYRHISKIANFLNQGDKKIIKTDGKDFIFLFDMLAHNCGLPATLRTLTYTSHQFAEFCKPNINFSRMKLTETEIRISWKPPQLASLDTELEKPITLQKYVVTIFPKVGEYYHNVPKSGMREQLFQNLEGGIKEYIITVSAIVSNAKMKGATWKTLLPPYPPQNLFVQEIQRTEGSNLKLTWIPPKGQFEKYILDIRKCSRGEAQTPEEAAATKVLEIIINKEEKDFVISNLEPGEAYKARLRSVTGSQCCSEEKIPEQSYLTQPLPPQAENIKFQVTSTSVDLYWQPPIKQEPDSLSLLESYEVELKTTSGKELIKDFVNKQTYRYTFSNLNPGQEYAVGIATICRMRDVNRKIFLDSKSPKVEKQFMSLPTAPTNLTFDKPEVNKVKMSWDQPNIVSTTHSVEYDIEINLVMSYNSLGGINAFESLETYQSVKRANEPTLKLANLPVSGALYSVSVKTVILYNNENLTSTDALTGFFTTRPIPPSDLEILDNEEQIFQWKKSSTKSVTQYKLKIRGKQEKTQDFFIKDMDPDSELIAFALDMELEEGVEYHINLYSQVYINDAWVDSNSLHVKMLKENVGSVFNSSIQDPDELDRGLARQVSMNTTKKLVLVRN